VTLPVVSSRHVVERKRVWVQKERYQTGDSRV